MEEQNEKFVKRMIQLRMEKGVSARDMSLSLGQSAAYINRIENGKMLPSMSAFFYICDFFHITPREFFNYEENPPAELLSAIRKLEGLPKDKRKHILAIIDDMQKSAD